MAHDNRSQGDAGVFFVYDHTVLQREEDDIKDAILFFYPSYVSDDDQCSVCGQLMGMSEFFLSNISQSCPSMFKLQREKFCMKRVGKYSYVLQGDIEDCDEMLKRQLQSLYETFVLFCGSIDFVKQQYRNNPLGFKSQMRLIWGNLCPFVCCQNNRLEKTFLCTPCLDLSKTNADLYLQASNLLQASQRHPGVMLGIVLHDYRVLCSQLSPELTKKLQAYRPEVIKSKCCISKNILMHKVEIRPRDSHIFSLLQEGYNDSTDIAKDCPTLFNNFPCTSVALDFVLPAGVSLVSVFLTALEYDQLYLYLANKSYLGKNRNGMKLKVSSPSPLLSSKSSPRDATNSTKSIINSSSLTVESLNDSRHSFMNRSSCLSDVPIVECDEILHQEETTTSVSGVSQLSASFPGHSSKSVKNDQTENKTKPADFSGKHVHQTPEASKTTVKTLINEKKLIDEKNILISKTGDSEEKKDSPNLKLNQAQTKAEVVVGSYSSCTVEGEDSETDEELQDNVSKDSVAPMVQHRRRFMSADLSECIVKSRSVCLTDTEDYMSESALSGDDSMHGGGAIRYEFKTYGSNDDIQESRKLSPLYDSDKSGKGDRNSVSDIKDKVDSSSKVLYQSQQSNTSQTKGDVDGEVSKEGQETGDELEEWHPDEDELCEATLYIQQHCDICMMLLMDPSNLHPGTITRDIFGTALSTLAELQFQVKNSLPTTDYEYVQHGERYLKYDSLFQTMSGKSQQILNEGDEEFQLLAGEIHTSFEENEALEDILFRSHMTHCHGHKTHCHEEYDNQPFRFQRPVPDTGNARYPSSGQLFSSLAQKL